MTHTNGGTALPTVEIVYRNPLDPDDLHTVYVEPLDTQLSHDWIDALKQLLTSDLLLEKNYCFHGFPETPRDLRYLSRELNRHILTINKFNQTGTWQNAGLEPYVIEEYFTPKSIVHSDKLAIGNAVNGDESKTLGLRLKHSIMNALHNHFEVLQGTVEQLSMYYKLADYQTKYAIRQLNNLCHEVEGIALALRKYAHEPEWCRPSQINTWLHAPRLELTQEHRSSFLINGYDREFGGVYMHWCQIGKTLFEVWRDEDAPDLNVGNDPTAITVGTGATCEAITALKYYSGEFDIEWAKTITYGDYDWYDTEIDQFYDWIESNNLDTSDTRLSLGYLKIAQVNIEKSFGTENMFEVWNTLSKHMDVYKISVDGTSKTFDYSWADADHEQRQIQAMKAGYDYSSS